MQVTPEGQSAPIELTSLIDAAADINQSVAVIVSNVSEGNRPFNTAEMLTLRSVVTRFGQSVEDYHNVAMRRLAFDEGQASRYPR